MPHWRTLLESDVIRFHDLQGQEFTLKIKQIKAKQKIRNGKGKAAIYFEGKDKPLLAGSAILGTIENLYGDNYANWIGKLITIYPDPEVVYGGQKVGGVRVRPVVPKTEAA